ncbi:hypothetical protein BDN72DRAFT_861044 [Pluteus cervinus]|uniref:Uncharacterized protein n=1 Tax=Pluteus cervinus TaxID=181527 RepID=A0ACD3AGR8_9AGAR|nr:hypothetical protein BDN72DRAFT_861044 [Pluteus cervinus]
MFAGSTPRLRNLEVVGCSVDINSSIFRDLTVLELCNIPRKLSATDILTTLRKIPLLTSLGLSYLLEYGAGPAPPQIGAVVLSSLKSLQISGQFFPHDLDFLSHLSFPATSVLHFISYTLDEEAIPALSDFLDVHKTARQQSSNAILCSINLQCSWSVLTLSLNTECDEQGHGHVADLVKFELASRWSGNLDLPDTPDIASFFSFFSLSSLRSITTNCKFDIGVWTKIFGTLPKLKRIVTTGDCAITGHCAIELLSSIIDDFQVNCPTGPRKNPQNQAGAGGKKKKKGKGKGKQKSQAAHWEPIFPSLEVIQMHDMVFTEQIVEDLVSAFRARKAAEKVMGIIGMTKCLNVEDDTVEALQEVVDHVVWDGWTGDKTWSIPDEESVHDSHGSGGFEGNYDGADDNNWDFS